MSEPAKLPRTDIQALRGIAVLTVLLYHTGIGSVASGYLGVDIFFVISGYLITTLVASGILKGSFRLSDFYFRRAKRLLPAAYVTFLVAAILAPWFLSQLELRDFATQLVGAVTFTANFVLWQQTGYFEGASDLKPLLHVWSLAIEEQYYFFLPASLMLVRPSRWPWLATGLVLASLGLCLFGMTWKPIATFYLLPTRGWELMIGSVGALWMLRSHNHWDRIISGGVRLFFIPSLLSLLALPFLHVKAAHPGWPAIVICFATMVVILRGSPRLNSAFPTKVLARVGDFSYSLYLVHWPIVAFTKNAWVGSTAELPVNLRLAALVLSFCLAYALYRLIEDPIRRSDLTLSRPLITRVAMSSAFLMTITPVAMRAMPTPIDFKEARKNNFGFSEVCEYKTLFAPRTECQNKDAPNLMVWGDSFAMHLVPGVSHVWNGGVIQATRSSCGPSLGLAQRTHVPREQEANKDQAWAESCIAFNQSVLEYLKQTPSIEIVVLSSPFSAYVDGDNLEQVIQVSGGFVTGPVAPADSGASFRRTVGEIRKLGKKVVVIAPPPSSDFNIGGCLERQLSGKVALGGRNGCKIDLVEYHLKRNGVLEFLNSMSSSADVSVIRFDPVLCDANSCMTLLDGTMIYRDAGHLSYAGSRLLAERMKLALLITEQAK